MPAGRTRGLALCVLALFACGPSVARDGGLEPRTDAGARSDGGVDAGAPRDSGPAADASPARDAAAPLDAAIDPGTYRNPVLDVSGDPHCLEIDGRYHLYLPQQVRRDGRGVGGRVVAFTSTDLVHWEPRGSVYDNIDVAYGGEQSRGLWAPEVFEHEGRYFLYLVNVMTGGVHPDTVGNKDIAVVASDDPLDFHGREQTVLLDDDYAFIDPSPFRDPASGDLYLLFKRRGAYGTGSSIRIRPLRGPRAWGGGATELLHSDDVPSSANILEHPMMLREGEVYFLLFSFGQGHSAGSDGYQIGYATSRQPTGRFTQRGTLFGAATVPGGRPVLAPGASSLVRDGDGRAWLVYRQKTTREETFADRAVCIDRVRVRAGASPPSIEGTPTRGIDRPAPTPLPAP